MQENLTDSQTIPMASSEIWGSGSEYVDSNYTNFQELQSSEFFRLVIATKFGRKVMLKALKENVKDTLLYQEILRKEFSILLALNHKSIVNVVDWENIEGYGPCIVMLYVDGITLDKFLKQETSKKKKVHILEEILDAVAYIHSKQIVHRDIKPSNIIVMSDHQQVKLIDFGLADSSSYEILKQPCGTIGYVSPEQCIGQTDIRNDIYSLGCIMRDMNIGNAYRGIISRCLADISRRPSSVNELAKSLRRIQNRTSIVMRIVPYTLIAFAAALYFLLRIPQPQHETEQPKTTSEHKVTAETIFVEKPIYIEKEPQYLNHNVVLAEAKKIINKDFKDIIVYFDTISSIDYFDAQLYMDFQGNEAVKLEKFARSYRGKISDRHWLDFYDSIFNYFREKDASVHPKWLNLLEKKNSERKRKQPPRD